MTDIDNSVPHSFLDSDDCDDAVNSSSAKVYFGPVLSPEKKLVSMFSQHRNSGAQSLQIADVPAGPSHSVFEDFIPDAAVCAPSTPKFSNHTSHFFVEDGLHFPI